ncbi:YhfC family intramembrane metalloprotease [Clostridium sp. DL1XJH146]
MVSNASFFGMFVSLFLSILFPIILMIVFRKKYKIDFKAVGVGVLIFVLFQVVTRIPLLSFLGSVPWFENGIKANIYVYGIFLALTAAAFEEVGRVVGFKYLLKKNLEPQNALGYGIGHSGIESILIVGLAQINNMVISIMINNGTFDTLLGTTPEIAAVKELLINTAPSMFVLGGFERVFTILFHIALSILVFKSVSLKEYKYFVYAFSLHFIIDFIAVVFSSNIWAVEAILSVAAVISVGYIIKFVKEYVKVQEVV